MKLGIIGNGFVGKATQMLNCEKIKTIAYDLNPSLCEPKGTTLKDIISCDLIFIFLFISIAGYCCILLPLTGLHCWLLLAWAGLFG